jgi:iron complex transport system permease protein
VSDVTTHRSASPGSWRLPGRQNALALGAGALALVGGVAVGMVCGPAGLALPEPDLVLLRGSRVALAVVVGAALSATGAALQSLLRNPLADPFVLGVSGGAAMGAAIGVATAVAIGIGSGTSVVTGGAIVGALVASALLVAFVRLREGGGADESHAGGNAILVGVVVNAFSWAVVATVRTMLPAFDAAGLSVWLIGSLHYPEPMALGVAAVATVVGLAILVACGPSLSLLQGGDDDARRLGVDVERLGVVVVATTSVLTGVAVATTGVIGFVGLLVPHAVRRLGAGRHDGTTIAVSALGGGGLLAALDGVARGAFVVIGSELAVGAVCALVGAPILAMVLVRDARGRETRGRP